MRYTTIIDITEDRALYRNQAARLVYLHLVLKSGYHDDDRDIAVLSIRSMAADIGLTVSAVRHAIAKLQGAGCIEHLEASRWKVRKWVPTVVPTSRRQVKARQSELDAEREREERRIERERKADETRASFDDRIEYMRQAYEKDPTSMAGRAYTNYLKSQQNEKKGNK